MIEEDLIKVSHNKFTDEEGEELEVDNYEIKVPVEELGSVDESNFYETKDGFFDDTIYGE